MALDRGIDQRGGEGAIVELLLDDVAHRRRREVVGRREERDDRAGPRIAAGPPPGVEQIAKDAGQAERRRPAAGRQSDRNQPSRVDCDGSATTPLGKATATRQPLAGIERPGRREADLARRLFDDPGGTARSSLAARCRPARWPKRAGEGRLMVAAARSIGKSQPLPVTFQYSSS